MKKYFAAENVFIFQFFLHSKLFFYKHSVLLGQTQYAHDFSKLGLILCLQNMLKFSRWGHSKSTYALKEGDGVLQKRAKTYKGRGSLKSVRTPILFLKQCSHRYCLFLFVT